MSDSLTQQIEAKISSVVEPLEAQGVDIISPAHVASAVRKNLDPSKDSPELIAWAATLYLRDHTRKFLAKRHDPVKKAEQVAKGDSDDLFGYLLQDYYPSRARDSSQAVYVRRNELTKHERMACVRRMRKAGSSLLQHADALEAEGAGVQL